MNQNEDTAKTTKRNYSMNYSMSKCRRVDPEDEEEYNKELQYFKDTILKNGSVLLKNSSIIPRKYLDIFVVDKENIDDVESMPSVSIKEESRY